jgi:type 1 fimbria pilin
MSGVVGLAQYAWASALWPMAPFIKEFEMNTFTRLLVGAALVAVLPNIMAASSAEVTVTGTIVPGACTPTLGTQHFDHGRISIGDLQRDAPTDLFNRRLSTTLNINCTSHTSYGIRGVDNRATSVASNVGFSSYGLGLTSTGEKIGQHFMLIDSQQSQIDGKPAYITASAAGDTWESARVAVIGIRNNGGLLGLHDTQGPVTGPLPVKDAALRLNSVLFINPTSGLTLNSEVPLDGAATIELVYL